MMLAFLLGSLLFQATPHTASRSRRIPLTSPVPGLTAPDFAFKDSLGRRHALKEWSGRSLALFFFCGCNACTELARHWAQRQRGGALPPVSVALQPTTLVIFAGSDAEATAFLNSTGLKASQTLLCADREALPLRERYQVNACPRVFVIDRRAQVCYAGRVPDGSGQTTSPGVLVSSALSALWSGSTLNRTPGVIKSSPRRRSPLPHRNSKAG